MGRFKWIEWNLRKIETHGPSPEEVEHAFEHRMGPHQEGEDASYESAGRLILIVWRYDEEFDVLGQDSVVEVVFVITAY